MNQYSVNVQDSPVIKTSIVNNIKITVNNLVLFSSATIIVNLFSDNTLIENQILPLSGTDYTDWGSNDQYIVDYVLNKLDLKPAYVSIRTT